MLDNNKTLGKNTAKTSFIQKKLLLATDANFYLGFCYDNRHIQLDQDTMSILVLVCLKRVITLADIHT